MNKGLNENLKKEFSDVFAVIKPGSPYGVEPAMRSGGIILNESFSFDMNWLIGFIEAEGCFLCLVRKNISHKLGYQVTLSFTLTQHNRDLILITKKILKK